MPQVQANTIAIDKRMIPDGVIVDYDPLWPLFAEWLLAYVFRPLFRKDC